MTGFIHEPALVPTATPGELRSEAQKRYDAEVLERVKAGIAFLEREHGPDWVDKIDMRTLNLASGAACVLGQVYREDAEDFNDGDPEEYGLDGYEYACSVFENREQDEADFEFDAAALGFTTDEESWTALQAAWEDALEPLVAK